MRHEPLTKTKIDEAQKEGFDAFLQSEQTKFMLSLIPEGAPPDAVVTLLRSTFNAGFSIGVGTMVTDLAKALLAKDRP